MSNASPGSFDDLIRIAEPPLRSIMKHLRAVVLKVDPDACEVVHLGYRSATYGVGPKKMSEGYVYIMPHSRWVNLGLYNGVGLPDPKGLLEGTGARLRHVKIRSAAEVERDLISERTKEGLAAAKAKGKRLGRPKGALGTSRLDGKEQDIRALLGKDVSKASIAKILDVSRSALYHFIQTRKIAPG